MHLCLPPLLKQIWVVSGMCIYHFTVGMTSSYPSSLLPALREPDSNFDVDLNTTSWIASSIGFSSMLGFFLVGFSMEYFGRKKSIVFIIAPGVSGWCLISLATNVTTIIIGRVLTGVTLGATIALSCIVISEYTSPEYRGSFINTKLSMAIFGNVIVHLLQYYATWRQIALMAATFNFLPVICLIKFPESPVWFAANGRFDECEKSFLWLRGKSDKSTKELDALIRTYKIDIKIRDDNIKFVDKAIEFSKNFRRKEFYKPLIVIWLSIFVFELSGRNCVTAYAMDIIGNITEDKTQSFYFVIVIDSLLVLYGFTSPIIVRYVRRRTILFFISILALSVLAIFCVYLYLASINAFSEITPWVPLSLFAIYFLFSNYGGCTVPYILMAELLPVSNKGVGTMLFGVMSSLTLQMSLLSFPYLMTYINVYGAFSVFGALLILILVVLYFILPETKDKTLIEINYFFLNGTYESVVSNQKDVSVIKF